MQTNILKVDDEFQAIETRTIDDRNRLTLGRLLQGSKRIRVYKNDRGKSFYSLLLKSQLLSSGFFKIKRPLKVFKRG